MSVTGVFQKGRGHAHEKVSAISRYIPRPRVPWQPSRFARQNLTKDDLVKMWGKGRYRTGYGNYNSGYSTEKSKSLEDTSINIIPKHELEKYMPDISLGPKALVTPVSLMSARNGHRVTHDMLHSYDAHIGALEKQAVVDHENITPYDSNFVGLNAATLDCRGRIYRWLRRGPFFQEDQYFRRYVTGGLMKTPPQETTLFKRVVRMASKGHLKAACEEYRKITTVPPVEVYRALTAACIPHGNLADAVSVFEDGNAKLFYVARDGEVLKNLMATAVAAKNRPRVMWVYNVMRGRFFENKFARAEIEPLWQYRITAKGLVFLLDNECCEEARVLYTFLESHEMLSFDLHVRLGQQMREAIAQGQDVALADELLDNISLMKSARALASTLKGAVFESQEPHERVLNEAPAETESVPRGNDDAVLWLSQKFPDVDVLAIMRLARFKGRKDLMIKEQDVYIDRCIRWLYTLSGAQSQQEGKPLTYLRKSGQSAIHENLRVAWIPESRGKTRLLPSEQNMSFFYRKGTRFVSEVYPTAGRTIQSQYLALQPIHTEVTAAIDFSATPTQCISAPSRVIHISAQGSATPTLSTDQGISGSSATKNGDATLALPDQNTTLDQTAKLFESQ